MTEHMESARKANKDRQVCVYACVCVCMCPCLCNCMCVYGYVSSADLRLCRFVHEKLTRTATCVSSCVCL